VGDFLEGQIVSLVDRSHERSENPGHRLPNAKRSEPFGDAFERRVVEAQDEMPIRGEGLRPVLGVNAVCSFELFDPGAAFDLGCAVTADLGEAMIPEAVAVIRLIIGTAKDGASAAELFDDADQCGLGRRGIYNVNPGPVPGWVGFVQVEGDERPPLRLEQVRQRGTDIPSKPELDWLDPLSRLSLPEHASTLTTTVASHEVVS
jgi:hypothetical protein